jgi:hypothetical protein
MIEVGTEREASNPIHKAKFSQSEDIKLVELVTKHGERDWPAIARQMPNRSVRQCRERWTNYLTPSVINGPWSPQEDALLLARFKEFGSRWRKMTQFFVGRTDINIKNHYIVLTRARSTHLLQPSPPQRPVDVATHDQSKSLPTQPASQPPPAAVVGDVVVEPPSLEWGCASGASGDWFSQTWSRHEGDRHGFTFDFFH